MNDKQKNWINTTIERAVATDGITHLEAICEYMQMKQIDPETMAEILSPRIKEFLRIEGYKLNFLGRRTRKLTKVLQDQEADESE